MKRLVIFLALLLFGGMQVVLAQKTITGKVTNSEDGLGIPGVTVVATGTNVGATTDASGHFSILVPTNVTTLRFSFVGMKTEDVQIGDLKEINVTLLPESQGLDELVVVGYGTQKKSDRTGSVSSVKGEDLTLLPVMRADQTLQGRAAGVVITNNDGAPGGSTTIRIRGGNSITGGNNALVVIDGFQGGDLSSLNPNEIASVEVLKDASATAIYGSRGANGVILVTTKSGKKGDAVIDYSYSTGLQKIANKIDLLSAAEYAEVQNAFKATQNGSVSSPITPTLPFTQAQIDNLKQTGGTDWQNELFRTANMQMHQLSVKGGTDAVKYFLSGGYMDQEGLMINSFFKRYTLRSNIDVNVNKWLKAGFYLNIIKDKGNVPVSGEGTRYVDILAQAVNSVIRFDPITPVYDALGNYSKAPTAYGDKDVWNPLATARGSFNESNNMTSNINNYLEFNILKGLTFKVTGSAGILNYDKETYYNHLTRNGNQLNGYGELTNEKYISFQNSNILTYDKTIAEKHHFTFTGVGEQQISNSTGSYLAAEGFSSDNTGINDIGGANQIDSKSSFESKRVINSFLGRVYYGYDNKYLLTVSYRADGASVFGANNKWGYFPSASLAWRASEEGFVKNLNLFSDLKVRGSWGVTGNQAVSPYGSLDAIGSGYNYPYNGSGTTDVGYAVTRAANPNLKWETTTQSNVGIDMGFFGGRLTATVDIYDKVTKDLLLNRPIPSYTGFTVLLDNVGSIGNKGIEISVGGDPLVGEFKWNTSVNVSMNKSEVLKLSNALPLGLKTNTGGGYGIYQAASNSLMYLQEGQPMGQMRGFVCLGTWQESERDSAKRFGQLPGDPKYKDFNGDHKITEAGDVKVIGNSSPKFVFGWSNNFSYKSFTLSLLIQGSQGNDIFNATRIKLENPATGLSPALNDRWTIDNQNTDVPAFIDGQTRSAAGLASKITLGKSPNRSSRWVEDGSYVRLKNITLGYNLPKSLISKVGLSNMKVYATAANILTFTKYSGYDPEVSSFNVGTDGGRGIDMSNYPTVKSITFGINLTF